MIYEDSPGNLEQQEEQQEENNEEKEKIAGKEKRQQLAKDFFFKQLRIIEIAFRALNLYANVKRFIGYDDE